MADDIIAAVGPVVAVFETLGVSYRIGGSVASSALGVPRSTLDVDLVCDLQIRHVGAFVVARDAIGVIAVQMQSLDRVYLQRWAASLGLSALLDRALAEAEAG